MPTCNRIVKHSFICRLDPIPSIRMVFLRIFFFLFRRSLQYFECIIFIGFTRLFSVCTIVVFSVLYRGIPFVVGYARFQILMRSDVTLMSIVKQINSHLNDMNVITVSMQCLIFLFSLSTFLLRCHLCRYCAYETLHLCIGVELFGKCWNVRSVARWFNECLVGRF